MTTGVGALSVWNPWANCAHVIDLYRKRCRQEVEEMTCAAQAAEIFGDLIKSRETLLDAGCGGGHYYHSFLRRSIPVDYQGLDFTPEMIDLARDEMCSLPGISRESFTLGHIEHLEKSFDNVICMNVLTNNPHYGLALERLLQCTRKRLLLRESMGDELIVRYLPDKYLDEGKRHIRVYHNTYPIQEVISLMDQSGFRVTRIRDRRSDDGVEMVVDIPHTWRILLAERREGPLNPPTR